MLEDQCKHIEVDNTKLIHEFKRGLHGPHYWKKSSDKFPFKELDVKHRKAPKDKATMILEYDRTSLDISKKDIGDCIRECNEQLDRLGDRAADLFDVVKYIWTIKANRNEDYVIVHVDEIADILGYKKRKIGGYPHSVKVTISQLMELLRLVQLEISVGIIDYSPQGKRVKKTWKMKSPAVSVAASIQKIEEEEGRTTVKSEYSWKLRPGDVLSPFLDAPNKRWAFLDRKVLELCPQKEKFAKRLGKSGTWFFKVNFQSRAGRTRIKVKTLLYDAIINVNERSPGKTVESFDRARELLVKQGIFKSFEYENPTLVEDCLCQRKKGWVETWLNFCVVLEPPDELIGIYTSKPPRIEQKFDAVGALKELTEKGFTLVTLASKVGCSQPYLSMLITGKKKVSKKMEGKIKEVQILNSQPIN